MPTTHPFLDYLGYCQFLMCLSVSFMVLQAVALTATRPAPTKPGK